MDIPFILATVMNGMLSGMALDQSVKQLPARRHMGVAAFSRYSRAADLKNGVPLYAVFGIGAPLSCALLAFFALRERPWTEPAALSAIAALAFSVIQLALTALAAPTNFRQLQYDFSQEEALARIFDRFERLQSWRTLVILLAFASVLGAKVSDGL